jgi:hypothetical protein
MASLAKDSVRSRSLAEAAMKLVGDDNAYARLLLETDVDCTAIEDP